MTRPYHQKSKFRFIDLFAGIGAMRKGFESIGGKCVFTSEWNRYSLETYKANYRNDHEFAGDISKVPTEQIPAHDLLLAGFPCQPFSIAGVSKKNSLNQPHGFRCETQGNLFFDIARILEYHRPKAFLLENVKHLLGHDKGNTFRVIHRVLAKDLGYSVSYRIIDAKFWVPQHRERIFIAGFLDDNGFSLDDMPIPNSNGPTGIGSILHTQNGKEEFKPNADFIEKKTGKVLEKYTLSDHLWRYLQNYAARHRQKGNGFGFGLVGPGDVSRTLSARYYKDGSEILIRQRNRNPRRLTPRECSRLMGFDKPGKSEFLIPVSDAQAYRQFGNAAVVPVLRAIAQWMEPELVKQTSRRTTFLKQKELLAVG